MKNFGIFFASILLGLSFGLPQTIVAAEKSDDRPFENSTAAELSTEKSPIAPLETSNILPSYSQIYSTYLPPIYAPPPVYVGPTITTYYPPAAPVYVGPPVVVRPWRPFLNAFLP